MEGKQQRGVTVNETEARGTEVAEKAAQYRKSERLIRNEKLHLTSMAMLSLVFVLPSVIIGPWQVHLFEPLISPGGWRAIQILCAIMFGGMMVKSFIKLIELLLIKYKTSS